MPQITPQEMTRRRGRGPSASKHRKILDAAFDSFLANGYAATSMEHIAELAGVSKQTVYAHFSDKQRLFDELIRADIADSAGARHPLVETMADSEHPERDLRTYARAHLADVMQVPLLRLRRLLLGEAERFPALAMAWYDNGPAVSSALFAGWFEVWHRRDVIHAPDATLAAEHFNWLVLSIPLNRAMAMPLDEPPFTQAELDHYADAGVDVFLAAYQPTPSGRASLKVRELADIPPTR